jgi:hypothetical protein
MILVDLWKNTDIHRILENYRICFFEPVIYLIQYIIPWRIFVCIDLRPLQHNMDP